MDDALQATHHPAAVPAAPGPRRRRWFVAATVTAVVVVGLAVAGWLHWRQPPPAPPEPDLSGADQEVVEAIQEARDEVVRQPSSAAAWGRLGQVLLAHEFNPEANVCLRQAEALDPREPAWPYLQGLNLIIHNPNAGIPCLERAAQCGGDRAVIPRLLLAEVLLDQGRTDQAQTVLEQVLGSDPPNVRARLAMGRLALVRQQWQVGLGHLKACRDDVHARKRAGVLSAEALGRLGEARLARDEQRRAQELPEDQPWPDPYLAEYQRLQRGLRYRFMTVDYLLQNGRVQDAIGMLQQTLEKHPTSLEGWSRLAEVWARSGRLDRAEACQRNVVDLAPDWPEAWFRLGCVQIMANPRKAAESFRQATRLKPDHAQAHLNLGVCLQGQGDLAGATAEVRAALNCRPDYEKARLLLRELETPKGKPR
jgi:cytochrome c-type biogenesis protein CcmH/NrfG